MVMATAALTITCPWWDATNLRPAAVRRSRTVRGPRFLIVTAPRASVMAGGLRFVFWRASLAVSGARKVMVILAVHGGAVQLMLSVSACLPLNALLREVRRGRTMSVSEPQGLELGWLRLSPL
jgi:hypothetical protein